MGFDDGKSALQTITHCADTYKEPGGSQWLVFWDTTWGVKALGQTVQQGSPPPGPTGGWQALWPWAETQFRSLIC